MKITEEYYATHMSVIEDRYLLLAEELTEQMFESMDWGHETKVVDAQRVIALWLKNNEQRSEAEDDYYETKKSPEEGEPEREEV